MEVVSGVTMDITLTPIYKQKNEFCNIQVKIKKEWLTHSVLYKKVVQPH
jgi:hypothetical protein